MDHDGSRCRVLGDWVDKNRTRVDVEQSYPSPLTVKLIGRLGGIGMSAEYAVIPLIPNIRVFLYRRTEWGGQVQERGRAGPMYQNVGKRILSNRLNARLRSYIREMKPMLEAGLLRLHHEDVTARVRYEEALQLCRSIEACVDELPAGIEVEVKRLFEFVASQGHTGERVN